MYKNSEGTGVVDYKLFYENLPRFQDGESGLKPYKIKGLMRRLYTNIKGSAPTCVMMRCIPSSCVRCPICHYNKTSNAAWATVINNVCSRVLKGASHEKV